MILYATKQLNRDLYVQDYLREITIDLCFDITSFLSLFLAPTVSPWHRGRCHFAGSVAVRGLIVGLCDGAFSLTRTLLSDVENRVWTVHNGVWPISHT